MESGWSDVVAGTSGTTSCVGLKYQQGHIQLCGMFLLTFQEGTK